MASLDDRPFDVVVDRFVARRLEYRPRDGDEAPAALAVLVMVAEREQDAFVEVSLDPPLSGPRRFYGHDPAQALGFLDMAIDLEVSSLSGAYEIFLAGKAGSTSSPYLPVSRS